MAYFEIVNNRLVRIRDWPKRLTKKRALQLSIRKWEFLAKNKDVEDGGSRTCALCFLHSNDYPDIVCVGCPIFNYTGFDLCFGTPYIENSCDEDYEELELAFLKKVYLDKYDENCPKEK